MYMCEKYKRFLDSVADGHLDRLTCGDFPWCEGCEYEFDGCELKGELDKGLFNYRREFFAYMEDWKREQ